MVKFRIILLIIGISFLIMVCECIRRRKLNEKYALLWIFSSSVILLFSLFPYLLNKISDIFGLFYLTTLLLICFFFLIIIVFSYSIVISTLTNKNNCLTQEISILKSKLKLLEKKCDKSSGNRNDNVE